MKATVHVVATYHGYHGDEVHVLGKEAEAEACVVEYAREYWNGEKLGPMPTNHSELCEAWGDHDLWGWFDSRWELVGREVELPDPRPSRGTATRGRHQRQRRTRTQPNA